MTTDGHNPNVASKNTRRDARELALRMLYQLDIGRQPIEEVVEAALAQSHLDGHNREFAADLVQGAFTRRDMIDHLLSEFTADWTLERQSAVDRNILRLAAYELQFRPDAPVAVVCNEAVELAKKYSTAESSKFVNGVLGNFARLPRGATDEQSEQPEEPAEESTENTGE